VYWVGVVAVVVAVVVVITPLYSASFDKTFPDIFCFIRMSQECWTCATGVLLPSFNSSKAQIWNLTFLQAVKGRVGVAVAVAEGPVAGTEGPCSTPFVARVQTATSERTC
jgi:hypothetical protein